MILHDTETFSCYEHYDDLLLRHLVVVVGLSAALLWIYCLAYGGTHMVSSLQCQSDVKMYSI